MARSRNVDLESKLFRLFSDTKLKTKDDLLTLFSKHLDFTLAETKLPSKSSEYWGDGQIAQLVANESFEVLATEGSFVIIYGTLRDFSLSNQRAIVLQLRKTFPDALYAFVDPKTLGRKTGAQINIVHARLRAAAQDDGATASRLLMRRFRFGPGERYRTAAERLAKIDLSTLKSRTAAAITALCNDAFDKEALTNEFFKKLDQHIKAIERDLGGGPDAFSQAQLLIERLIFLYFAQNRGWLNQEPDYLVKNFAEYRDDADGFGYYQEFLHRLFRTLSEAPPAPGDRLPGVPFLNGGLFDDDEFKPASSRLRIRNATFASLFDDLLEAYNFTVREDTPLSQEVAVDPEMLGKIFESIVLHAEAAGEEYQAPDKRKATGSYYTPRIVVHFICRENLRLYFANRAQLLSDPACHTTWSERTSRLFKEIDPTDGFSEEELRTLKTLLSPEEARRCYEVLRTLRTLDPAVGSGAFPVGLLHELISLQRIFETAMRGYKDPVESEKSTWAQQAKEYFIQKSLFGVDIQQQAIEICRLRLWLSLLVDYELGIDPFEAERAEFINKINKISQLPNLEMNFKRGDSLHDYVCGKPVRIEPQKPSQYAAELQQIEKLGAKLHKAKRGETKKKYRLETLEKRIALAQRIITDEIAALKQGFIGSNWFGESLSEREERERTEREIARLETALRQLERDEANLRKLQQRQFDKDFYRKLRELEGSEMDGPLNFAWRIDFPHVLSGVPQTTLGGEFALVNQAQRQQELTAADRAKLESGFDLVVGNPPFVTARNPEKRELYRERWPRVCHMKFLLVCPFFEMSFGLLRPDGQLGFIVSNAFAKREFGKPLVEDFFPTVDLQKIIDCSGLLFPGHGTPTCLVFGAQRKPDENSPIRVAAILPGGGDLRTTPEESPLWHTLAAQHDKPGFANSQVIVADRDRKEMSKHPWSFGAADAPTSKALEANAAGVLRDVLDDDVGVCTMTNSDDVFVLFGDQVRRLVGTSTNLRVFQEGDTQRNWSAQPDQFAICPYSETNEVIPRTKLAIETLNYLKHYKTPLEERRSFGNKTFKELGREFYEFERMNRTKYRHELLIPWSFVSTHIHALPVPTNRLFKQSNMVASLSTKDFDAHLLVCAILNSDASHLWLKQVCYNKGAGEDEHRDRFEFSGTKVQQLPIPAAIADALRGKSNALAEALTALAGECWGCGRELPSLGLRKLFEKPNEAYHAWNASLPGYVKPHRELGAPFSSTAELEARFACAREIREKPRREMIARQEEMDWLVYAAYGLIPETHPAAACLTSDVDLTLDRDERPFRLWAEAVSDFDKALALIPAGWSAAKKKLWRTRLETIRDNEHIRRIEQPVYKRRWDEQWKVGNRWTCGLAAYAQELVDAFSWWLSEKAEWHLEHKEKGGPIALPDWSAALFKDTRVAAAWEVAADAIYEVEKYKFDALDEEKKKTRPKPKADNSYTAFERFFRDTVLGQSVAHGIPPAKPWNELAEKKKWIPAQLKKAQAVRGKLNVPRERFQQISSTDFVWAGSMK